MERCRMISIDASTKKTALAIFDNGIYKNVDLIDCSKKETMEERFPDMAKQIFDYLMVHQPYLLYIEETVVERNASTQRFLTRLQGVVYTYCMYHNCEYNTIRPTEWRKLVGIGQGKKGRDALKKEAIEIVLTKFGIEGSEDQAEAILIGMAVLKKFEGLEKSGKAILLDQPERRS